MVANSNKANIRAVAGVQHTSCGPSTRRVNSVRRILVIQTNTLRTQHVRRMQSSIVSTNPQNQALMANNSRRVTLPSYLPRPTSKEVRPAALEALSSGYTDVHPRLVREHLVSESHSLIAGLHSADFTIGSNANIPRELIVPMNDFVFGNAVCPTHILALPTTITGADGRAKNRVSLYPVHELVMAASCASFPPLPLSDAATEDGNREHTVKLPVVPLNIPSAWTFPIVQSYIYTKDSVALQSSLLPQGWDASTFSILKAARTVQDVWKNAIAFGVVDEITVLQNGDDYYTSLSIYDVIEQSWAQVLQALQRRTTPPPPTTWS